MYHADRLACLITDRKHGDRMRHVLFHDVQGFRSQLMVGNDPRVLGHHGIDRPLEEVGPCFQAAADVAVGVSADSEDPVPQEKPKKEYLGIILDEETEQYKDELIDVLATYPGDITVYFKINGKNYKMDKKVRNCSVSHRIADC